MGSTTRRCSNMGQHVYLDRSDLDPGGVPPLPFPALDTHGP